MEMPDNTRSARVNLLEYAWNPHAMLTTEQRLFMVRVADCHLGGYDNVARFTVDELEELCYMCGVRWTTDQIKTLLATYGVVRVEIEYPKGAW